MKFGTVRCRNSTVDFARWDGAVFWNTKDRRTSDECPEEDITAAEFRGSNLHLPWFLDDLKDIVLSCSLVYREFMRSENVRAFCHCVSSVTVVRWQKVNLTNNHLIFQNKIGVILCENNWRLIWHIIQHMALASSYWTTKNKGYGFYWPTLYIYTNTTAADLEHTDHTGVRLWISHWQQRHHDLCQKPRKYLVCKTTSIL